MARMKVNGIELEYRVAGQGPRLLFIDGTGSDLRARPNVFDGPLAERFEVLSFDHRGLGRSDKPDEPYTMAGYAADTAGLIQGAGRTDCAVMGYSFGGMVAQHLALERPDLVSRLVLASTSSGGAGGSSYPIHEMAHLPPERMVEEFLALADNRLNEKWRAAHPDEWRVRVEQMLAAMALGADEPGRAVGARRQLEARLGHDTFDRLKRLTMPVLVCGGRNDSVAPPSNQRALAGAIPGAELLFMEGGHAFFKEDPATLEPIIGFLSRD